jgi:HAD superfamily hydrolase (TIGR01509 family)
MSAFSAIMFDMDGVLADTERLKGLAHIMAIARLGHVASLDQYAQVMGQSSEQVRLYLLKMAGASTISPGHYDRLYHNEYSILLNSQLKPMPGAVELVQALAKEFRIAVVSSADRPTIDTILERLQIIQLVDAVVSSDDVSQPKPSAEPYILAAARLRIPNCRGVAFEDTSAGVESAIGAGSPVIAVRHELNKQQDFSKADVEVESLLQQEQIMQFLRTPPPNLPCRTS